MTAGIPGKVVFWDSAEKEFIADWLLKPVKNCKNCM